MNLRTACKCIFVHYRSCCFGLLNTGGHLVQGICSTTFLVLTNAGQEKELRAPGIATNGARTLLGAPGLLLVARSY